LDLWAYLRAGKTEFWRAHRAYAGVIHFVYLTCSYPGVYTADHFRDVRKLELDPAFADYLGEAFKPLGVYVNFFQTNLAAGSTRTFKVMLVNDRYQPAAGKLRLALEDAQGKPLARTEREFGLEALGDGSYEIPLTIPRTAGRCTLKAVAQASDKSFGRPTVSRRWVSVAGE
jgi:hypothetical protein